jgi:hypothetical protein
LGGTCDTHGGGGGVYRVLVGRPEGKRPLGRLRHRLEHNINMDLRELRIDTSPFMQIFDAKIEIY